MLCVGACRVELPSVVVKGDCRYESGGPFEV